jgi:hypothetical protein
MPFSFLLSLFAPLISSPQSFLRGTHPLTSYAEANASFVEHVGLMRPRVLVQLCVTPLTRLRVCWPLLHCRLRDALLATVRSARVSYY